MTEQERNFYDTLRMLIENPQKYVLLDTETTGLGYKDQVIELGILDMQGNVLLNTLAKPTCRISPEAQAVHHITDAMLASAPGWPEVWAQAEPLLKGKKILAYNAPFDVRMLKQTCIAHGLKPPFIRSLCLMEAVTAWLGFRPKLEYFSAGIQSHRSVDDCRILLDNVIMKSYLMLSEKAKEEM